MTNDEKPPFDDEAIAAASAHDEGLRANRVAHGVRKQRHNAWLKLLEESQRRGKPTEQLP
jgi:hypothetical protein